MSLGPNPQPCRAFAASLCGQRGPKAGSGGLVFLWGPDLTTPALTEVTRQPLGVDPEAKNNYSLGIVGPRAQE